MPPVITVENLEFSYGTAPVLRGLDRQAQAPQDQLRPVGELQALRGDDSRGQQKPPQ